MQKDRLVNITWIADHANAEANENTNKLARTEAGGETSSNEERNKTLCGAARMGRNGGQTVKCIEQKRL